MTDHLKLLFDQLRLADQHLTDQESAIHAAKALREQAHDALWTAIEAELDATTDMNDVKESIQRLESLVLAQSTELRQLRDQLPPRP